MENITQNSTVSRWLLWLCALVILMVGVGGATRLTESGLSIVEWKPVVGVIPPGSDAEWQVEFQKYQYSPQYRKINRGMTLPEFKKIYYWEYFHRLVARLLGLVFLLPYAYFLLRRMIPVGMRLKIFYGFILGGLQGALGWYMVKSGLVDHPEVSHFRLAAHLVLAFVILGYLYWQSLNLRMLSLPAVREMAVQPFITRFRVFFVIFILQVVYGAFTAGLNAGMVYNTFPDMGGEWIPKALFELSPAWTNFVSGIAGVQFLHRILGWLLLGQAFVLYIYCGKHIADQTLRKGVVNLVLLVVLQFLLGVATILMRVWIPVAVFHQVNAAFVLLGILYVYHRLRRVT